MPPTSVLVMGKLLLADDNPEVNNVTADTELMAIHLFFHS